MIIGQELIYSNKYSPLERIYIRLFGVPINGLRIRARRILPYINKKYNRVLDAGCGPGIFSFEIARKLPQATITGIDIDSGLIIENRYISEKLRNKNCVFEQKDILTMDYFNQFDLAISIDNLEHIENDDLALKNIFAALCPGGDFILHVPGLYRRWLFFKLKMNFHVNGHYRPGYIKEDIVTKVENAGFKINEVFYTYGWLETITNNISYLITGAEMRNKILYAIVFPFLNFVSYFGKGSKPKVGAGILLVATKQK